MFQAVYNKEAYFDKSKIEFVRDMGIAGTVEFILHFKERALE